MPKSTKPRVDHSAIILLAEIKTALEAFERGETNACDTIDAVLVAVEAHHTFARRRRKAA